MYNFYMFLYDAENEPRVFVNGDFLWDFLSMEPVAYLFQNSVFSYPKMRYIGYIKNGAIFDSINGRPILIQPGTSFVMQDFFKPFRPLTPFAPFKPFTPLKPLRPLRPLNPIGVQWSQNSYEEWIND